MEKYLDTLCEYEAEFFVGESDDWESEIVPTEKKEKIQSFLDLFNSEKGASPVYFGDKIFYNHEEEKYMARIEVSYGVSDTEFINEDLSKENFEILKKIAEELGYNLFPNN